MLSSNSTMTSMLHVEGVENRNERLDVKGSFTYYVIKEGGGGFPNDYAGLRGGEGGFWPMIT